MYFNCMLSFEEYVCFKFYIGVWYKVVRFDLILVCLGFLGSFLERWKVIIKEKIYNEGRF